MVGYIDIEREKSERFNDEYYSDASVVCEDDFEFGYSTSPVKSNEQVNEQVNEIPDIEEDLPVDLNQPALDQANVIGPDDFEIVRVLGRGGFGKVMEVRKKTEQNAGKTFAMKTLKKSKIVRSPKDVDHINSERRVLGKTCHPFICGLFYAFHTPTKLYLILEMLQGGELFMLLEKQGPFYEIEAQFYAAEILLALEHLHQNGVIYRDLKPENVLLDRDGHVKLADFGLCKDDISNGRTYTYCGTVVYMAPEIILRTGHNHAVDFWALGILIFDMLVGNPPFTANGKQATIDRILNGRLRFPKHLSSLTYDLIKGLLQRTANKRMGYNGAKEIKDHAFFSKIKWNDVYNRNVQPPFKLDDAKDGFFDPQFTTLDPVDTPSTSFSQADDDPFESFDYVSPSFY